MNLFILGRQVLQGKLFETKDRKEMRKVRKGSVRKLQNTYCKITET